jgi:hypothetical protein
VGVGSDRLDQRLWRQTGDELFEGCRSFVVMGEGELSVRCQAGVICLPIDGRITGLARRHW